MTYPHDYASDLNECVACGVPRVHADPSADCPAAMRQHIADLSRLQASIIKAQAAGYAAGRDEERAAVVSWLRARAMQGLAAGNMEACTILGHIATAIEAGRHHESPATGEGGE